MPYKLVKHFLYFVYNKLGKKKQNKTKKIYPQTSFITQTMHTPLYPSHLPPHLKYENNDQQPKINDYMLIS